MCINIIIDNESRQSQILPKVKFSQAGKERTEMGKSNYEPKQKKSARITYCRTLTDFTKSVFQYDLVYVYGKLSIIINTLPYFPMQK